MFVETEKNLVNLDLVNEIFIKDNQVQYGYIKTDPNMKLLILGDFSTCRDAQRAYEKLKNAMTTGEKFFSIKDCKGFVESFGWFE